MQCSLLRRGVDWIPLALCNVAVSVENGYTIIYLTDLIYFSLSLLNEVLLKLIQLIYFLAI